MINYLLLQKQLMKELILILLTYAINKIFYKMPTEYVIMFEKARFTIITYYALRFS